MINASACVCVCVCVCVSVLGCRHSHLLHARTHSLYMCLQPPSARSTGSRLSPPCTTIVCSAVQTAV